MRRYLGLHITRTAGTSLADLALRTLGRHQCLMLSSFTQSMMDHERLPQERGFETLPTFSFGHYVHESLWGMLALSGPVFAFTVLREPRGRFQSIVRHMQALGVTDQHIDERLRPFPNPTCVEILRCLPIADEMYADRPLHERALAALSAFDRVATMDDLPTLVDELAKGLGVQLSESLLQLNSADAQSSVELLREFAIDDFIGEDELLWQRIGDLDREGTGVAVREAIAECYRDADEAREQFFRHLDHYFLQELEMLSSTHAVQRDLAARLASLSRLVRVLDDAVK